MKKIALLLILFVSGCSNDKIGKKRPETIPASAEWAGGEDGGYWVDYHLKDTNKIILARLYQEDGTFQSETNFTVNDSLHINISQIEIYAYDGKRLFVKDLKKNKVFALEPKFSK